MRDPYVYPHTNILKNLANIQDEKELSCMEAEYTSLRLAELVTKESASCFDFATLCDMHHYIFQDIYEWAGKIRVINIEKSEPALGGISIEYSDCFDIEKDVKAVVDKMNDYHWDKVSIEESAMIFSKYLAELWKVHPYREGNTRTVIAFCSQLIESKGLYIDSDLFKDNAQYVRTALVAASATFSDLGDKRKPEYLERIVLDSLRCGGEMKNRVSDTIKKAGFEVNEETIRSIVYWNRLKHCENGAEEVKEYLLNF